MKSTQRLLVLLITATMLLSGSFVQVFATEEAKGDSSVVVSETVGSEDPIDIKEGTSEGAKEEDKDEVKDEAKDEQNPSSDAGTNGEEKQPSDDKKAAPENKDDTEAKDVSKAGDNNTKGPAIAKVTNNGATREFEYLITTGGEQGAFDYANTLRGEVVIEMLKDAHENYTLGSGFNFNNSNITSLTISGVDGKTTLEKAQTRAPMITTTGINTVVLNNIVFNGNDNITTGGSGGAVNTNAKTLNVSYCIFNKCQAGRQGGGINHNNPDGSTDIKYSEFNECRANGPDDETGAGGGGLCSNALSLTVTYSTFDSCTTRVRQGAGLLHKRKDETEDSTTEVKFCKFKNCVSVWSGGGMESDARSVLVEGTEFKGCKATDSGGGKGGAINVWANGEDNTTTESSLIVKECFFGGDEDGDECTANENGGAIRSTALNTTIEESHFTNCSAEAKEGGAVACNNTGTAAETLTINNCTFSKCKAFTGGAITFVGTELTVIGGSIKECSATGKGGGIDFKANNEDNPRADSNTKITINGCKFDSCSSGYNGGAVRSNAYEMNLGGNASFNNCTSKQNGGAVANTNNNASPVITACTFTECKADSNGGACFNNGPNLTVDEGTSITKCSANNGGGISSAGTYVTMNAGTISGCTATSKGGAINGAKITMNGGTISDCSAGENGGAINGTSQIDMNDGTISGCSAKGNGGAINGGSPIIMTGGAISGCSAKGNGGAINGSSQVTMAGGEISGSSAEGNGGAINGTTINMNGGTISGSSAEGNGGAIKGTTINMRGGEISDSSAVVDGGAINGTTINMNAGAIAGCSAAGNGGAINGTTINMNAGAITECSAAGNGGAINSSNKITMSSGTISGCSATSATSKGGALYSSNTITMTGGTVTGNETLGESAAVDANKRQSGLVFSGNVVIEGNTGSGGEARDVYIGVYSGGAPHTDQHIQINRPGLGEGASIGVYVAIGEAFDNHGKPEQRFARTENNVTVGSLDNLDKLFSDRLDNGPMHGVAATPESGDANYPYRIMWSAETQVAPTNVNFRMMPYILILLGGAALVLLKKVSDRRRRICE